MKKLIVFDLDGTLAESKARVDTEMASLLSALLTIVPVAVISGGDWPQFATQLLANLSQDKNLARLSLLPTCGTKFYRYNGVWQKLYSEDFSVSEKAKIESALTRALGSAEYNPDRVWGDVTQDRGSQITFSALGQNAPIEEKNLWDPGFQKRARIKSLLQPLIPDFTVALGGATSIDITKPGIDKGYGIRKLEQILHIGIPDMLFMGDALFPGGNDYPAKEAGALSIRVRDPHETKRVIEAIIACLGELRSPVTDEQVAA